MAEYIERRTAVDTSPLGRPAVVEKESDIVIRRSPGMSNATVAAIIISLITAAVLITFMIMSANQQNRESELMHQRDLAEANARMAQSNQQPTPQQPAPVVITPQPAPTTTIPVPVPTPAPSTAPLSPAGGESAVSDASIEVEVNSRLMDDEELRAHPVEVKFAGGTVILSGEVPNEDLKTRAGKIARTIKEVRKVVNNITVIE